VAIAGAVATPLALAVPAASADSGGTGSAYGIAAAGPLVNIPPTPSVQAPGKKSLLRLPANPLIRLGLLDVSAKPGHARASVVDLRLVKGALSAHLITARCDNGRGSSALARASLAGHRLAAHASPNTRLSVLVNGLGTVSVTLNKQVRTADGRLTVTALEVGLPLGPGKRQVVDISSASCSAAPGTPPPSATPTPPAPTSPAPTSPGEAPKPTPVPSNLPVTG
jgi:hypothetical protein